MFLGILHTGILGMSIPTRIYTVENEFYYEREKLAADEN